MGTRRIRLKNVDKYLICDAKDYGRLSAYRWYARWNRSGGNCYAVAFVANARGSLRNLYAHRVVMNAQTGQMCDHINHNSLDCRRSNLRFSDHRTNARNAVKARKSNRTSEYKGVSLVVNRDGSLQCWRARIHIYGKTRNIGSFPTERKAARAYDREAVRLFGEFARPNFNGNANLRTQVA